jgi:hypothetical protein
MAMIIEKMLIQATTIENYLSLHEARTSALREIQDYSTESIPAAISLAYPTTKLSAVIKAFCYTIDSTVF